MEKWKIKQQLIWIDCSNKNTLTYRSRTTSAQYAKHINMSDACESKCACKKKLKSELWIKLCINVFKTNWMREWNIKETTICMHAEKESDYMDEWVWNILKVGRKWTLRSMCACGYAHKKTKWITLYRLFTYIQWALHRIDCGYGCGIVSYFQWQSTFIRLKS